MDTDKEKVSKLEDEQLDNVKGGFVGTIAAVVGLVTLLGGALVGASCVADAAKKK